MTPAELRAALIEAAALVTPNHEREFLAALRAYEDVLLNLDAMTDILAARSREKRR